MESRNVMFDGYNNEISGSKIAREYFGVEKNPPPGNHKKLIRVVDPMSVKNGQSEMSDIDIVNYLRDCAKGLNISHYIITRDINSDKIIIILTSPTDGDLIMFDMKYLPKLD